jgi:predicted DNA-binding antitoxin AbrB/MazE fold protein
MSEIVKAVYENGKLRPLQPLKLRERQTVRIQVLQDEPVPGKPEDEVNEVIQNLIATGLMHAHPERDMIPPTPLSAEERKELANRLGRTPGKSASEMVIKDRSMPTTKEK